MLVFLFPYLFTVKFYIEIIILPSSVEISESLECDKFEADAIDIRLANFMCCNAAAASLLKGLRQQRSHKYSSGRLFLLSNTQSTCCQTL